MKSVTEDLVEFKGEFTMKQRVLSALIGVVLLLFCIWKIDTIIFVLGISILCLFSSIEISDAVKNENKLLKIVSSLFAVSVPILFGFEKIAKYNLIYVAAFAYIFVISSIMLKDHKRITFKIYSAMIFGTIILPLMFSTIVRIGNARYFINPEMNYFHGIYLTVFAFCCSWLTDTFAYFVGVKFGKHKMCPTISPKKSVEGAIGGFVLSIVFNTLIYVLVDKYLISLKEIPLVSIIILSGILSILGMIGDLTASVIKRNCGIKDFGKIMPGHGGFLDRFDSCIFVFPTLYFVLQFMNLK